MGPLLNSANSKLIHHVITYLFDEILTVFGNWDPFLNDTGPTVFLVYAMNPRSGKLG